RASGSPRRARSPTGSTRSTCRRSKRTSRRGRRPMADTIPPVREERHPGTDHPHHGFRTLTEAPRFTWPGEARIAFTVTLVLDHWEINPPENANPDPRIVSPLGKFFPDWLTWSQREYGARVGIFRVLDALDRFGLTPSVALGAAAATRYPELVDELIR